MLPSASTDEGDRGGEDEEDERHRDPARQAQPLQVAHERIEQERDHRRGEEEEEHVPEDAGQHPDDQQPHRQADELNPARDPDRRP